MTSPQGLGRSAWIDRDLYRQIAPDEQSVVSRKEQILVDRASRLAELFDQEDAGEQMGLLLVRLGGELYGLDARCVERVQPVEQLTRVPRVPDWVRGVTNLRGRLLSVVDLVRFFGLPERSLLGGQGEQNGTAQKAQEYLVVIKTPEMELALLVADVLAVEDIPTGRLQEASAMVRGLRAEYVRGIAERSSDRVRTNGGRDDLIVVLDLRALLADDRLIVHEEVV
jgi:purine-binding chemotaxis protein CheW